VSATFSLEMAEVTFVVTEHTSFLDSAWKRRYEVIRATLEEISGRPVRSIHYPDVERLGPGPVVLSGSGAPWDRHDPAELERLGDAVRSAEAPMLGICAGLQLLTGFAGGRVEPMAVNGRPPERGYLPLEVLDGSDLLAGPTSSRTTWTRSRSCLGISSSSRERPVARSRRSPPRSVAGGARSSTRSVSTPVIRTGGA
jgi:hypothetical protein